MSTAADPTFDDALLQTLLDTSRAQSAQGKAQASLTLAVALQKRARAADNRKVNKIIVRFTVWASFAGRGN
jgi:hypothetical protein